MLARGFFPTLWDDLAPPSVDLDRSYAATWLERDLRQLLNVSSLRDFDRFLRVLFVTLFDQDVPNSATAISSVPEL